MNIVDSSGWLEYFADGTNADFFAPAIENTAELVVPAICIYEVFKRVSQQRDENDAIQAVAIMTQGQVVNLDVTLALDAARLSIDLHLPMADSLILATARLYDAIIWTQDADFEIIDKVRYISKKQK
jgi:predicted nucleic acid-binding protein